MPPALAAQPATTLERARLERVAFYGVGDGPPITFNLNGFYDLSSMLIGYTVKDSVGVFAPTSVDVAVNNGQSCKPSLVSITVPIPTRMATLGLTPST